MPDSASDLLVARRRKLEALRARGEGAYPNDFTPDRTIGELRARFGDMDADRLQQQAEIVRVAGRIIVARDFNEVETPMMQLLAGGAAARPFVTHHNALDLDLYLRIAPELYLKRLVVGGFERVFELSRVFRNEGTSTKHNPEFTLLEFYMAYADYRRLMDITEELFCEVARGVVGGLELRWNEHDIDLTPPWQRMTLHDAVCRYAGASDADLASDAAIRSFAERRGLPLHPSWGGGKVVLELFE